jgi:hypothetical protein
MGVGLVENESDQVVVWAPLPLLPPGLLKSSHLWSVSKRKPISNSDVGLESEENGEDDEDAGKDSRGKERFEVDEWEGIANGSAEIFTAGEASTAGESRGGKSSTTLAVRRSTEGVNRVPAGKWLGLLDLTESDSSGFREREILRRNQKRRKIDEVNLAKVIDLTESG